jgi:hypothetical protein
MQEPVSRLINLKSNPLPSLALTPIPRDRERLVKLCCAPRLPHKYSGRAAARWCRWSLDISGLARSRK